MPHAQKWLICFICLYFCNSQAEELLLDKIQATTSTTELLELPLEQALALNITTSVSKKPQSVHDSAAAVFVISADDIRRSGATSIPEALRMAPGLQVARINANQWAVSVRGFNQRTANKLLVLMDGRTLYLPIFSGTFWETQDIPLENIDRIEVIRGPGATLWGANAVNGVINIITKNAAQTQGTQLSVTGGDDQVFGFARQGFQIDEHSFGRIDFQAKQHDNYQLLDGSDNYDAWQTQQGGLQLNLSDGDDDALTVQANALHGQFNEQSLTPLLVEPYTEMQRSKQDSNMFNLLSRWDRTLSADSDFSLQVYYDYQEHEFFQNANLHQFDLDFQHHFSPIDEHNLIWGLNYRFVQDNLSNSERYHYPNPSRAYHLYSGFIQDEVSLIPEQLKFIFGTKFEHNAFSGFEVQPNARLIWTPDKYNSIWTSISKALMTPSRSKQDIHVWLATEPPSVETGGLPLKIEGDAASQINKYEAEQVLAYELGYRFQNNALATDLSLFYNDYKKLPLINYGQVSLQTTEDGLPYLLLPVTLTNGVKGYTYGAELSTTWQATDFWKLNFSYSYIQARLHRPDDSLHPLSNENPQNQLNLRSSFDILPNLELDFWYRYVDELPNINGSPVAAYNSLNIRLGYRPIPELEFAIVGNNLIEKHLEFNPDLVEGGGDHSLLDRHFYLQATYSF